jgi:hypothetical protein
MRSYNFWRLMFNKVTSRSYGFFIKVLILFLVEKWIPPSSQKLQKLVKKTEGILGVNLLKNVLSKIHNEKLH